MQGEAMHFEWLVMHLLCFPKSPFPRSPWLFYAAIEGRINRRVENARGGNAFRMVGHAFVMLPQEPLPPKPLALLCRDRRAHQPPRGECKGRQCISNGWSCICYASPRAPSPEAPGH